MRSQGNGYAGPGFRKGWQSHRNHSTAQCDREIPRGSANSYARLPRICGSKLPERRARFVLLALRRFIAPRPTCAHVGDVTV